MTDEERYQALLRRDLYDNAAHGTTIPSDEERWNTIYHEKQTRAKIIGVISVVGLGLLFSYAACGKSKGATISPQADNYQKMELLR